MTLREIGVILALDRQYDIRHKLNIIIGIRFTHALVRNPLTRKQMKIRMSAVYTLRMTQETLALSSVIIAHGLREQHNAVMLQQGDDVQTIFFLIAVQRAHVATTM